VPQAEHFMTTLPATLQVPSMGEALEPTVEGAQVAEFQTIFESHFPYVCRSLRRLGVAEAEVEDLAQELFVTVYDRLASYDRARPIRPWLFAFAVRIAANHKRGARVRREIVDGENVAPVEQGTPEDHLSDRRRQEIVLKALERVPVERRAALVLHDVDGFAAPEIAEALGIPINTVYSRVRVARQELQRAIERLAPRRR
jgi:RNA polymerase sigma-70 factor (ECF subfamily)